MHDEIERWDVVIIEDKTAKVESFGGQDMPLHNSFHTVTKRLATVRDRLNDDYSALAVPTGMYKIGDVVAGEWTMTGDPE